jgi:hypothetical protein
VTEPIACPRCGDPRGDCDKTFSGYDTAEMIGKLVCAMQRVARAMESLANVQHHAAGLDIPFRAAP